MTVRDARVAGVLVLALCAALLSGCVVDAGESGDALTVSVTEVTYYVPESVWRGAPVGCEGRIMDDELVLARAAGAPGLGVVLDDAGQAVCVDTWESIRTEIRRAMGDPSPDPMRPVTIRRMSP